MERTEMSGAGRGGAEVSSMPVAGRGSSGPVTRRHPKGLDAAVLPAPHPESLQAVSVPRRSFQELYCQSNGVRPENFARSLLFSCVKGWALPIVAVQYVFRRSALEHDFRLIEEVSGATTYREFMGALENFTFRNRESGFLREIMRMRMSAKLLMKTGSKLLRHTDREALQEQKEVYAGLKPGGQPQRMSRRTSRRF